MISQIQQQRIVLSFLSPWIEWRLFVKNQTNAETPASALARRGSGGNVNMPAQD